jgi:hypothetical protein
MEEKSLEDRKTELEIKKLQLETNKSKRMLDWISLIPNFITAIIAIGTLVYAINQDILKNLAENLKNDNKNLNEKVDSLNNDIEIFTKQRAIIISEISRKKLELREINEKYAGISRKLSNTENYYAKAFTFIKYFCVNDLVYNDRLNHPYTLRFNKTNKEIVEIDLSKMDFIKFLKTFAGYVEKGEVNGSNKYLNSNDSTFTRSRRNILIIIGRRGYENEFYALKEYSDQFECWKKLPKDQKVKLLRQVIVK